MKYSSVCWMIWKFTEDQCVHKSIHSYHVQFFGASAERSWLNEASLMVYEGREKFMEIVQFGLEDPCESCKSPDSFRISPAWFPVWTLAVNEADSAFKLSREERKVQYTFKYVYLKGDEQRPVDRLLEAVWQRSSGLAHLTEGGELSSDEEDFFGTGTKKWTQRTWYDSDDFYSSDEEGEDSSNSSRTSLRPVVITVRQGQFDVFLTRHGPVVYCEHPDWTQGEVKDWLHQQWSFMSTLQRSRYVTRHEKPVRIVARSNGRQQKEPEELELVDPYDLDLEIVRMSTTTLNNNLAYKQTCDICFGSGNLHMCGSGCGRLCHDSCGHLCDGAIWCPHCTKGTVVCFACHNDKGALTKCAHSQCVRHYHKTCVMGLQHTQSYGTGFVCPLHVCSTCAVSDSGNTSDIGLIQCRKCPKAYHSTDFCVPAGSEVNLATSFLVCPGHFAPDKRQSQHCGVHVRKCMTCGHGGQLLECCSCPMAYHNTCLPYTIQPPSSDHSMRDACSDGKQQTDFTASSPSSLSNPDASVVTQNEKRPSFKPRKSWKRKCTSDASKEKTPTRRNRNSLSLRHDAPAASGPITRAACSTNRDPSKICTDKQPVKTKISPNKEQSLKDIYTTTKAICEQRSGDLSMSSSGAKKTTLSRQQMTRKKNLQNKQALNSDRKKQSPKKKGHLGMKTTAWQCGDCAKGKQPMYGDIVWVRLGLFRWWPAEICHPSHIPANLIGRGRQVGEFPVQFFGSYDFAWVHRRRVYPFSKENYDLKDSSPGGLSEMFRRGMREAAASLRLWTRIRERWSKEREMVQGERDEAKDDINRICRESEA